jgi:DNA polymerase-3 subunit delta
MKIAFKQVESFVKAPVPEARVILVYGPDAGLVRERAARIGRTVVADLNDPFNAVTLTSDRLDADPARLQDEASAMSMMGGRRLIRIEDADDGLTPLLKDYLANPSPYNLILLEAGVLGTKSSLRALCEKSPVAAALACYVDEGKDLASLIRETLRQAGYGADSDAVAWLAANIAGDRARVRSELEKLVLYMESAKIGAVNSPPPPVRLEDAIACCGETGAQSMDDLIQAIALSRTDDALQCYVQLLQEGQSPVAMLRILQAHFRKLHLAQGRIEAGMTPDEALKRVSPPIFFKYQDAFSLQLRRWPIAAIETVLQRLTRLEAQAKQTGVPVETLCGHAFLSMSRMRA